MAVNSNRVPLFQWYDMNWFVIVIFLMQMNEFEMKFGPIKWKYSSESVYCNTQQRCGLVIVAAGNVIIETIFLEFNSITFEAIGWFEWKILIVGDGCQWISLPFTLCQPLFIVRCKPFDTLFSIEIGRHNQHCRCSKCDRLSLLSVNSGLFMTINSIKIAHYHNHNHRHRSTFLPRNISFRLWNQFDSNEMINSKPGNRHSTFECI